MPLTIPLTNDPSYKFRVDLDGQDCQFKIRWSVYANVWLLDFSDLTEGRSYNGLRLLGGVDLFKSSVLRGLGDFPLLVLGYSGRSLFGGSGRCSGSPQWYRYS